MMICHEFNGYNSSYNFYQGYCKRRSLKHIQTQTLIGMKDLFTREYETVNELRVSFETHIMSSFF